jgi:hypothetical protein
MFDCAQLPEQPFQLVDESSPSGSPRAGPLGEVVSRFAKLCQG